VHPWFENSNILAINMFASVCTYRSKFLADWTKVIFFFLSLFPHVRSIRWNPALHRVMHTAHLTLELLSVSLDCFHFSQSRWEPQLCCNPNTPHFIIHNQSLFTEKCIHMPGLGVYMLVRLCNRYVPTCS